MESIDNLLKKSYAIKSQMNSKTLSSDNIKTTERDDNEGLGKSDCAYCGGLGYYLPDVPPIHPSFGRAIVCSCRAAEFIETQLDNLQKISQIGALENHTFDSFAPEGFGLPPSKKEILKNAYDHAFSFAQNPAGWLILQGGYGSGKTHLGAAIANYCLSLGRPTLFINVPDLLDHLRSAYSPNSSVGYDKRFEQVRNIPLLILDDLGTQSNTEWAQEKLYQIFNHRYVAKLPTVITTNQELGVIDLRIRSRMEDVNLAKLIRIDVPDFRRGGYETDMSSLDLHGDKLFKNFNLRERELKKADLDNLYKVLQVAKDFAENPSDWIVFNSVEHGNGKTHLAAAIANHVKQSGEPVLFIFVPDLLDHLRATYNPSSLIRYDRRFDYIKKFPLLILDDLGVESATPWAKEKLYQLFNYRYNARLPTVITSATPIEEMDNRLQVKLLDGSRCAFVVLEVNSFRSNVKSKQKKNW